MNERYSALVFTVVVLVSSLAIGLPGAGAGPGASVENLDRGEGREDPPQIRGDAATDRQPSSLERAGVEALHGAGVDGETVSVGVIGKRFAPSHRSLDGAVAGNRQFGGRGPLFADGSHGTAVAEIVTRTAPRADLYLAGVGSKGSPERYADAVAWLLEQDVDVVVDAASYFPANSEGMDRLNAIAAETADEGVVFVTSAGNYADRHWAGTAGGEGWVSFAPGTEYNELGTGEISGDASLRLYWEGDADFDLYLYRERPGEDSLVAKSARNQSTADSHSEAIDITLPNGEYYVAVQGDAAANGSDLELFAATHELAENGGAGSMVAPATAENVIAVGAADPGSGEARSYSSDGPNLDISAPDGTRTRAAGKFYGSSAAAPLVAGTVALMASQNESLSPAEARRVLQRTATRTNGRLYLDTPRAVDAVSDRPLPEPTESSRASTDGSSHSTGDGRRSTQANGGLGTAAAVGLDKTADDDLPAPTGTGYATCRGWRKMS
jgi:hypothetical protein